MSGVNRAMNSASCVRGAASQATAAGEFAFVCDRDFIFAADREPDGGCVFDVGLDAAAVGLRSITRHNTRVTWADQSAPANQPRAGRTEVIDQRVGTALLTEEFGQRGP